MPIKGVTTTSCLTKGSTIPARSDRTKGASPERDGSREWAHDTKYSSPRLRSAGGWTVVEAAIKLANNKVKNRWKTSTPGDYWRGLYALIFRVGTTPRYVESVEVGLSIKFSRLVGRSLISAHHNAAFAFRSVYETGIGPWTVYSMAYTPATQNNRSVRIIISLDDDVSVHIIAWICLH